MSRDPLTEEASGLPRFVVLNAVSRIVAVQPVETLLEEVQDFLVGPRQPAAQVDLKMNARTDNVLRCSVWNELRGFLLGYFVWNEIRGLPISRKTATGFGELWQLYQAINEILKPGRSFMVQLT